MNSAQRSRLVWGILLILIGAFFLGQQFAPDLFARLGLQFSWPWIIIGVGALLLVVGLLSGTADMAIPAFVVGGIGAILYYQNSTGDWASWSYAWTLLPGLAGLGQVVAGLLGSRENTVNQGLKAILTSIILFLIFGSFLGGFRMLGTYWPLLLVLAGLLLIGRSFIRRQ